MERVKAYGKTGRLRRTHIICTMGPKSANPETTRSLLEAGMDIARFNFSHGTYDWFRDAMRLVREGTASLPNKVCGIALDTKGPEIRTGLIEGGPNKYVTIQAGSEVTVTTDDAFKDKGSESLLYVDYKALTSTVKKGSVIFVDDGMLALEVVEVRSTDVLCRAKNKSDVGDHKGVNLPGCRVTLPALSEQDKKDLAFGVEMQVDMAFVSFIRSGDQVREIRDYLASQGPHGSKIMIISKIENEEGLFNFDQILKESDGIMVARGDLGIEIPLPRVATAQKMMCRKCNLAGKSVITATQMLESMIKSPRPTRAEVTDVTNAVLDGSDCVMLSGETANGLYPAECVRTMSDICIEAERQINHPRLFAQLRESTPLPVALSEAMAASSVALLHELQASAIIVLPHTGRTARFVAKYRPNVPVVVAVTDSVVGRQCLLSRGLLPLCVSMEDADDVQHCISLALNKLKSAGVVAQGDYCIALHSELVLMNRGSETSSGTGSDVNLVQRGAAAPPAPASAFAAPPRMGSGRMCPAFQPHQTPEAIRAMGSLPDVRETERVLAELGFHGRAGETLPAHEIDAATERLLNAGVGGPAAGGAGGAGAAPISGLSPTMVSDSEAEDSVHGMGPVRTGGFPRFSEGQGLGVEGEGGVGGEGFDGAAPLIDRPSRLSFALGQGGDYDWKGRGGHGKEGEESSFFGSPIRGAGDAGGAAKGGGGHGGGGAGDAAAQSPGSPLTTAFKRGGWPGSRWPHLQVVVRVTKAL